MTDEEKLIAAAKIGWHMGLKAGMKLAFDSERAIAEIEAGNYISLEELERQLEEVRDD